ncbi:hypothetical protein [Arhodomonas sp. AD133]|uniref:hypothetical protein n=1 Tax=Arhodomonas sp. AD133 TaxID=3415009 RepID=UPI003EB86ED8
MTSTPQNAGGDGEKRKRLCDQLDARIERLANARSFAKGSHTAPLLDVARRLMLLPDGIDPIYQRIGVIEEAGLFAGSDWATPEVLQPGLTVETLRTGTGDTVLMECLSDIRLLAVALDDHRHPSISSEGAQHYLAQVLALNLDLLYASGGEAQRARPQGLGEIVRGLLAFLVAHIGYDNILDRLIEEVWRILTQRPVRVDVVKSMITQIAVCVNDPTLSLNGGGRGADRLVSALFGPTQASMDDPGLEAYRQRLDGLDATARQQEASGFARAMHDTGLVSAYHAVFLRDTRQRGDDLVPAALGLSSTGREALLCYPELVGRLIDEAIYPETAQAVYGLAMLLERGILYAQPVAPALWRQLGLPLADEAAQAIARACGDARPPRVHLLADVLNVLGLPFGVGQGNNPTCQSARAISMWAHNDPDYLLQMVAWAARDNEIVMAFEGQMISSRALGAGLALLPPRDVDAVSAVLVPHLDRVYIEMGRLCQGRNDDPHRWINPEFHGWWVGHGLSLAVSIDTGKLSDYQGFVRHFYATYHPLYNGGQPMIHPQPAGLAVTDSAARFVGWHAISILRVALDQDNAMRVYFFNPNNDSGQDLGNGITVSTHGCGEVAGESSLPFAEFVSRLYLFHYDPLEHGDADAVPAAEVQTVEELARMSWAANR